jgi:cytochrome c2
VITMRFTCTLCHHSRHGAQNKDGNLHLVVDRGSEFSDVVARMKFKHN